MSILLSLLHHGESSYFLPLKDGKCCSGLPFPTPGDFSDRGIKFASLASPALGGGFFFFLTTAPPGKSIKSSKRLQKIMQKHPLRDIFKELVFFLSHQVKTSEERRNM